MKLLKDILQSKERKELHVVFPDQTLEDALNIMLDHGIHHLVVVEKDNMERKPDKDGFISHGIPIGMISDRDMRVAINTPILDSEKIELLSLGETLENLLKVVKEHKVKEIMSSPVIKKELETPISSAINLMVQQDINALPVVHKDSHELVGIVTRTDLLSLLKGILEEEQSIAETGSSFA